MYKILSNKYYRMTCKYSEKRNYCFINRTYNKNNKQKKLNKERQTTVGKMEIMNCDGFNYSDTLQSRFV